MKKPTKSKPAAKPDQLKIADQDGEDQAGESSCAPPAGSPSIPAVEPSTEECAARVSSPERSATSVAFEPATETVQQIMAMGFEEAQVKEALLIANGNPNTAIEFLFDPDLMVQAREAIQRGDSTGDIPMNPLLNGMAPEEAGAQGPEGAPQLTEEQVVQMMEQEPGMFSGMLQALVQQHPEIAQLAQQDPQSLVSLMTTTLNQAAGQVAAEPSG